MSRSSKNVYWPKSRIWLWYCHERSGRSIHPTVHFRCARESGHENSICLMELSGARVRAILSSRGKRGIMQLDCALRNVRFFRPSCRVEILFRFLFVINFVIVMKLGFRETIFIYVLRFMFSGELTSRRAVFEGFRVKHFFFKMWKRFEPPRFPLGEPRLYNAQLPFWPMVQTWNIWQPASTSA